MTTIVNHSSDGSALPVEERTVPKDTGAYFLKQFHNWEARTGASALRAEELMKK